jgi:hypothetical protein
LPHLFWLLVASARQSQSGGRHKVGPHSRLAVEDRWT